MRDKLTAKYLFPFCITLSVLIHSLIFIQNRLASPRQQYARHASENELAIAYVDAAIAQRRSSGARPQGQMNSNKAEKLLSEKMKVRTVTFDQAVGKLSHFDSDGELEIAMNESTADKQPVDHVTNNKRPEMPSVPLSVGEDTQEDEMDGGEVSMLTVGVTQQAVPLGHVNLEPEYPQLARRRGWEGVVVLKLRVEPDGQVSELSLESSSGRDVLDQAALRSVAMWRYQAAERNGKYVASWVSQPVEFRLNHARR